MYFYKHSKNSFFYGKWEFFAKKKSSEYRLCEKMLKQMFNGLLLFIDREGVVYDIDTPSCVWERINGDTIKKA